MPFWVLNFTKGGTHDKKQLAAQARKLLEIGLWGIPPTSQLKDKLKPGDHVLAFVGAPERLFVGTAEVESGWHEWSPDEVQRHPTPDDTFSGGIGLKAPEVWPKPLPLFPVWEQTQAAKTNPKARWYSGIASLTDADAELILIDAQAPAASGSGAEVAPTTEAPMPPPESPEAEFFKTTEELRNLPAGEKLSEYKTRAFLLDKYIYALGYTGVSDVDMGDAVASGSVPDYVLRAGGKPVVALEAKALGSPLGAKEAGQIVQYCGGLGVRWGLLSDGRYFKLYDAPVVGKLPEERLVFELDLAEYEGWADFESNIWPIVSMLSKQAMGTGRELDHYAARELARSLLTDSSSKAVAALRQEMLEQKVPLSDEELRELLEELLA